MRDVYESSTVSPGERTAAAKGYVQGRGGARKDVGSKMGSFVTRVKEDREGGRAVVATRVSEGVMKYSTRPNGEPT